MEKINFKSYKCKKYRHIDKRIMIDRVIDYITDPEKVARHSFLPFLRYERKSSKYVGYEFSDIDGRPVKFKIRPLMYAGHLDGLIYKYYSDLLNICYNEWMEDNELNFFSVAYRTNKQHQSSINFAAEAISFIEKQDNALIIIGDFEKFFDTLDHKLLKDRLQRVLKVQQLPSDWYNIYKSLTKFAFIEKSTLDFSDDSLVLKNDVSYFRSIGDFRKFQKYNNGKYIDCIAYAISKVSDDKIQGLELFIIPIVEFEKYVQPDKKTGDVLSRASNHYHYNYAKYSHQINELVHDSWMRK